jgi:hypothetical protein
MPMSFDEVRRHLNDVHKVDVGDHFATVALKWREFLARPTDLRWFDGGREHFARHETGEFVIHLSAGTGVLQARFRNGGSRILARGGLEQLKARADAILRIGGPFGGPCSEAVDEAVATSPSSGKRGPQRARSRGKHSPHVHQRVSPPEQSRRTKSVAMTGWRMSIHEENVWVHDVGAGYEARIRPVCDQHALFVIGPRGTFCFDRFGLLPNVIGYAGWFCRTFDDLADDFGPEVHPFHVRVRGMPQALTYTPLPGLAGHVRTDIGDLFLCILGANLVALVVVNGDAEPICIASGRPGEIIGWELFPSEASEVMPEPLDDSPEEITSAIGRASWLTPVVRAHFVSIVRSALVDPGTRTARSLVWALCRVHAKGQREDLRLPTAELFVWLHKRSHLPRLPEERSQRAALSWLSQRTPLVTRLPRGRTAWAVVHFTWFGAPSEKCLAEIARSALPSP